MRKPKKKLYCGKAIGRRRFPLDLTLRVVVFALVVVLAVIKLPEAKARVLSLTFFRLDSIALKGNRYLLDSQILDIAGVEKGTCGLGRDIEEIRLRLLKHPRIKSASVKRFLWKKLYITVEERAPMALVDLHKLLEIDDGGIVFEPVHSTLIPDLPVITGVSHKKVAPGDTLRGGQIERALALLKKLRSPDVSLYDQISEVHIDNSGALILISVHSGTPVLVGSEVVTVKKLQALRVALADMQRKDLMPASVDLRFKDQIVAKVARQPASDALSPAGAEEGRVALF